MKTLHTIYSTFAKHNMAKFLTVLTMLLIVGIGQAWAETKTYSYTFSDKQFSANGSKTLNSVSWTLAGDGGYWGYDGTKGQQFGSGSKPYKTLTLSTSEISGTITKIIINTSGASSVNASFTVSVGGTQWGNSTKLTTSATNYTFTGSNSGEIKFSYTQTSSKALYIKSISVTYETAVATVPVTGVSLNKSTLTLTEGDSETLTATITPADATDKTVTWTTNKSSVATVSDGKVTAVAEGSATITVTTNDGNKTATCSVTVNPKPKYTVILSAGPGSCAESVTETSAGKGVTLPEPTLSSACQLEGWSFAGWTTSSVANETSSKPATLLTGTYKPSSDITLYAVYQRTETTEGGGSTTEETTKTYTFSNYTAGTQYAAETHVLDENVTINIQNCHLTTQLRIYSSASNNGTVISNELPGRIVSMGFNMGYKTDKLLVYGSTNGTSWTQVGSISTTTSYEDYTLDFGETEYTYFKLDVEGTNQIRVASMSITWESTSDGGTTTTYYHSTPECTPETADCSLLTFATNIAANHTATYTQNATATALTVSAKYDGNTTGVTYQWYSNTSKSNTGGTAINGATNASYTPLTSATGTKYYYCVATYDEECTITSNVATVTIIAPVPTFTVTFDSDGGSAVASQTIEEGNKAIKPEDPTKNGYEFAGWYNGNTEFDFSTSITGDLTLKAKWNIITYDIEYTGLEGATHSNPATYTIETATITFADPSNRDGYVFKGWTPATIAKGSTGNKTVTATWAKVYTITWMVGGNEYTTGSPTTSVESNQKISSIPDTPNDKTLADCGATTFMGWSTDNIGSTPDTNAPTDLFTTVVEAQSKIGGITENKTFYAVFATAKTDEGEDDVTTTFDFTSGYENATAIGTKTQDGVTITFGKGDNNSNKPTYYDSGNAVRVYAKNTITIACTGLTKITFTFGSDDGSNAITANTGSFSTPTWTGSANSVKFTIGGSSGNRRIQKVAVTYTATTSVTTYSNYVTNCCATPVPTNGSYTSVSGTEVQLKWNGSASRYHITCANPIIDDHTESTSYMVSSLTECEEYTFYVSADPKEGCESEAITITAQPFSGAKTVTFNYNGNGQANTTSSTSCGNTSITLPTPTWAGYRLMGWFNAASGGTKIGEAGASYKPTDDITLYAHWAKEYSVTYNANGGSTSCTSGNYIAGETVTVCTTNPSKTGHTFTGWTYSPEVTITDGKFTMPASDVTITAQWTINQYTVTWKPNGGNWAGSTENIVHTYDYGAKINLPADPTRDGYRFTGWNGTVASTMPATNITYTAQWKQNYTITFHDGDDVTPWTQTKDAESIDLNNYVGTHACGEYNFAGWSTDATQYNDQTANITTWVTGTYTPTASIDLYAVYVKGDLATDFTLNCDGGVYKIWEKGTNQHMAGRQNGGGDKFYTTEYWDANNSESNGAPFTITKVADNTYTLQNADGQYITRDSYYETELEIEETWENADRYKWIISKGTNGSWRFTNKAATTYALVFYDKYFQLRIATNVTNGSSYYDLELTPAQTNVYQSNPNCGPYTITFETGGGEFIQGNYKYSTKKTSNLTEPTISQFPAAELDGYTFAGWKDGSPQEDINYEPYLKKADDNLVVSSNKTYHAVYYYYDEEEDIDWSKEFTTSIYADVNGTKYFLAGTPNRGTMSSTTDCGYVSEVTVTPGTGANAGKYKITVNDVGMAPEAGETHLVAGTAWWTITETSAGSGEYKISGEEKRNIVLRNSSFGHYAYNAGSSYGAGYYYPRFGKCLEHHWTSNPPIKLTVTYNPNGATSGTAPIDSHYYMEGDKVSVLGSNDLQKENYAFGGWNTQADGLGDNYEEGEDFNITKKTTLYAKWDCATYVNITKGTPVNGTFNLSVTGTQYTCEDGFVVSVTDIVPATGYRFDHITQDGVDAANVMINNNAQTVTYDKLSNGSSTINVVFAARLYTVTWDPNGGNWGGSTDSKVDTYNYGASITKPADPTRVGYTFAGWSPTPTSSMPAENVTYTALWTANTNTPYVVEHYQQNLDLSYPTTPTEKESFTGTTDTKVTPTVKTYEGFTSPATQEVTIAADGSLVVRYEYKRNSYKLTWELNGGTITAAGTAAGNVLYGAELKAPQLSKVDNVFMGWKPEVPATMPADDATYVAQWIELTNFRTFCKNSVTWVVNGGKWADGTTADIVDIYTRGQEIIPPTDPTLDGWKFMGWDPEFVAGTTMQGEDLTYVAQWAKAYTLTYDANGGNTTCEDNNEYAANDIVTVCNNQPTKAGYTFDGWMRSDNNSIVQPDATFAMPATDVTLIAQWTPNTDTKYVVEHYQQNWDGTYPPTPTEREELAGTTDTQVTPAVKSYDGFTAPATQTVIIAAAGNLVVKYEYTRNSYNLAWDLNGGTVTTEGTAAGSIKFGAPITAPVVEKVGHNFEGWEDQDGNPVTITTMPAKDATYKAIWEVASHKVTWDPAGGHWNGDHNKKVETYEYGAEIVKPANPEKTGYAFIGWQPEVEEIMQNSDLTYTAQWGEEFCKNYSFHWGSGTEEQVRNDNHQACFTQKDDTHEWQVTHFTIPADTKYFVGLYGWWYWSDLGVGDSNGQKSKSVMKEWTWTGDQVMYLAHVGRGYTLGHAVGAVGTLRIYDNTSLDNLDVAFIPNGYGITLTSNSSAAKTAYAFRTTTVDHKWETDVVKMPGITNNKYTVGLATQVDNEYVASNHSKAPENLEKMGVTEVVEGKRMIYLKPNDDWKTNNARFAAYFFGNGDTWVDMTDANGDGIYECEKPDGYTTVIFCRMKPDATANNWNNKWNQTQDIALSTDGLAKVCTITGWDYYCTDPTNMQPKTGQNGKFRMWDNSTNENWFVHFVPYYLLSYDPNGGEGTMRATEYNTEDANNKVTVAANEFTRTGYDFVAWNTKADGTGTTYQPGATYTMTADDTLYAIWKAQTYNIIYKDQGGDDYSGSNEAELPKTHTYGKATELVDGEKIGYTFEGWYDNQDCTGDAITKLGAKDYIADITLYAKWTFAMEYDITNTETIFITSAKGQNIKATQPLILEVSNMPIGTTIDLSAGEHIHFYYANEEIKQLTNKSVDETFELEIVYNPEAPNTTEKPSITLNVLGHEKVLTDRISCRSLPTTFAIVANVGGVWYALPSQGLNSTTPPAAYPVEVDNMADPTTVTAVPANADWSLRQVYAASRVDATKDRFKANGDNLVFVNNASPAMALNASSSGNYVLTDAQYANYYQTNPGLYEWTPTTTDLETYTLTNEQRADRTLNVSINTVFGVHYDNKATTEVRFLPIENRYTPLVVQVLEWKENSVVVMYNGDPAQTASVSVNGGSAQTTTLSSAQKDIAVYELAANGLATNPTQRLSITIGSEKVILPIPYIISGETTDLALLPGSTVAARQEVAKVADLVVLKDAKLTAAGAKSNPYKFRNVTIYGGGKLVIPSDKGFGVASLTLRAGGITDAGEYDYVYPQFDLKGTFTNSTSGFYYDYITDYDHWYHLVLPFAGDLTTIKYPTEFYGANVAANNTGSWVIKRYAGEIRATGNYNAWKDIEAEGKTATSAGKGYIFWGAPKKVTVNGETARQKWGIQRITMPITADNAIDAENDKEGGKTISNLGSYEDIANNSGKPNDQGWNLIGNPYMVDLTNMSTSGLHACKLVEVIDPATGKWNGQWEWNDDTNIRYLTIPSEHFDTYTAKTVKQAVPLVAGRAFFIQLEGEANSVTFSAANRASLLAARVAANEPTTDIETGIVLSNETMQDEVNFWIKDGKTNDYEYNADYPKTPNNTNFNIYGVHAHGDLSWVATGPEYAEESMPIGYQVPAAGTYMLSISETYDSDLLDALYVTDHALSPEVTVDLMSNSYEFSVNQAETNNERFTVSMKLKSDNEGTVTGLENTGVKSNQPIKFIYQDKIFILHNETIYDATGKKVTTINK